MALENLVAFWFFINMNKLNSKVVDLPCSLSSFSQILYFQYIPFCPIGILELSGQLERQVTDFRIRYSIAIKLSLFKIMDSFIYKDKQTYVINIG